MKAVTGNFILKKLNYYSKQNINTKLTSKMFTKSAYSKIWCDKLKLLHNKAHREAERTKLKVTVEKTITQRATVVSHTD